MKILTDIRYKKISHSVTVDALIKEVFRKSIHVCSALIPLLASVLYNQTIIALSTVICLYIISEYYRVAGKPIPFVTGITIFASRKRDEGRFILGPVTLSFGILLSLLMFPLSVAKIGIFSLAFGDGIASIAGKLFGKREIPYSGGKTLEGSFACFIAVFLSTLACTGQFVFSIEIAILAMLIEVLPLRDYDNLVIPIIISFFAFIRI